MATWNRGTTQPAISAAALRSALRQAEPRATPTSSKVITLPALTKGINAAAQRSTSKQADLDQEPESAHDDAAFKTLTEKIDKLDAKIIEKMGASEKTQTDNMDELAEVWELKFSKLEKKFMERLQASTKRMVDAQVQVLDNKLADLNEILQEKFSDQETKRETGEKRIIDSLIQVLDKKISCDLQEMLRPLHEKMSALETSIVTLQSEERSSFEKMLTGLRQNREESSDHDAIFSKLQSDLKTMENNFAVQLNAASEDISGMKGVVDRFTVALNGLVEALERF